MLRWDVAISQPRRIRRYENSVVDRFASASSRAGTARWQLRRWQYDLEDVESQAALLVKTMEGWLDRFEQGTGGLHMP
ncbi:MAG: hypothetical protein ACREPL_03430 [Rhodanobacteraceae bacterium]